MNYDKLVRRTANVFPLPNDKKLILTHLRHLRNEMVHDLEGSPTPQSMFMLLRCVHGMLHFCLASCNEFDNSSELFSYLDLSQDKDRLKMEIRLRKKRLKQIESEEATDATPTGRSSQEHFRVE